MTSDGLEPSTNKRTGQAHRSIEGGCSTHVGSCSGTAATAHDWSSCRDISLSGTFETQDTYDYNLNARRFTSTSTESPENTSSGRGCSKSTFPDYSHCSAQKREMNVVLKNIKGKAISSISNKRRRAAAIHNQSERKRRCKINQKMTMLQKLVPNSDKTDKASMLNEVIEYMKQLQAQLHVVNKINMPPMMMQSLMQQQQIQMMMASTGLGMEMGGMNMNTNIGLSNIPICFQPSMLMHTPSWNTHTANWVINPTAMHADPMSAFLACQSQPVNIYGFLY